MAEFRCKDEVRDRRDTVAIGETIIECPKADQDAWREGLEAKTKGRASAPRAITVSGGR
jgi:hypothetical protein